MRQKLIILLLFILCIPLISGLKAAPKSKFTKAFDTYGTIMQIALPVSAGVYSLVKHDYTGAIHLAEGFVYSQVLTEILKYSAREMRPDGSARNSFPSGHTMCAMNGAAYMQFRYGYKFGIPSYILGASVAASRIQSHRHYWWDVAASTVFASVIQYLINKKGMSVAPYILGKGGGVAFSKTF